MQQLLPEWSPCSAKGAAQKGKPSADLEQLALSVKGGHVDAVGSRKLDLGGRLAGVSVDYAVHRHTCRKGAQRDLSAIVVQTREAEAEAEAVMVTRAPFENILGRGKVLGHHQCCSLCS